MTNSNKNNRVGADLKLGKVPTQKRAEKTVGLILETTAQLIQEVGIEGFTTNLLAKRAGINIATIYRYFPNKNAILHSFYQKWKKEVELLVEAMEDLADPTRDWREVFDWGVNNYIAMTRKQPGYMELRRAMKADLQLREIEQKTNRVLANTIATLLAKRGLKLPKKQLQALSRSFIEVVATISDLAWSEGKEVHDELLTELKLIYHSYLTNYLD